jgi:hypothetical protein
MYILNIYVSDTHIAGLGGQTTSAPYIDPLVSMTTDTVTINGSLSVTGAISTAEVAFLGSSTSVPYLTTNTGDNLILSTGAGNGLQFSTASGSGTILCTGSNQLTIAGTLIATVSSSSSDYRLKEEIEPISDEYSIDKLKPCSYLLKDNESKKLQTGFIAHELQEIFPHLVIGEKDGEEMQSINYIGLIAILTKELQSLKSVVEELKADNIMLKEKLC